MELSPALLTELAGRVGQGNVLTELSMTAAYARDWTGRFRGATPAVVRPGSTDEVVEVIRLLADADVSVVPQGGNTGLVGGGVPLHGEVVVSLQRLAGIGAVDGRARQVTADAGVTLEAVCTASAPSGLTFGVSTASRGSATVGGTVSTNAGGLRMLRYGNMAAQVVGLEAVLADGTVLSHLGGLTKDNTGYPWHSLFAGAEGTLGIITRARLRLVPALPHRTVVLAGLPDVAAAVALVQRLLLSVPNVDAIELLLDVGVDLVCRHRGLPQPLPKRYPAYLVVETAGLGDSDGALLDFLSGCDLDDVAHADDEQGRRRLWRYRELHTEAINGAGVPIKLDLSVPMSEYAAFAFEVQSLVARVAPSARCVCFGHIADGNLHVNVLDAPDTERVEDAVFSLVTSLGGSISAEHGIGTAKKRWLPLCRSVEEIGLGQRLKRVFDPGGVLNPHAIYDGAIARGERIVSDPQAGDSATRLAARTRRE